MKKSKLFLFLSLPLLSACAKPSFSSSSASEATTLSINASSRIVVSSATSGSGSSLPNFSVAASSSSSSASSMNFVASSATSSSSSVPIDSHLTGNTKIDEYYKTVDWSLKGQAMKEQIANLLNTKQTSANLVGYKGMRTYLPKCDLDPNGSGKILGFYDEAKLGPSWDSGATWNREHVWPDSLGGNVCEHDPHMVRPAAVESNSDRGNDFYAASGAYDPGWAMPKYRGISARIIFYCATKYWSRGLKLVDTTIKADFTMGKLGDMLKWNKEYAIDVTETHRNEVIYGDYNLRNPFIDHPELADIIFGASL